MEIIEFPEQTVIFAKNQPPYRQMPAHVSTDDVVTCCWKLNEDDIEQILVTGLIWHQIVVPGLHTQGTKLQPQLLLFAKKPVLEKP
jgi:hypothetical protein